MRRIMRERDQFNSSKRDKDEVDMLKLEVTQLSTERDQLVRQLEKSQDMLLSFQQDLNLTENELKRMGAENRRLKEEADKSERGVLESKEKEIKNLNDRIRAMEFDYDDALKKHASQKIKADKAEREISQLQTRLELLEAEAKNKRKESVDAKANLNIQADSARFDAELSRLTKERDSAQAALDVCKLDLNRLESQLKRAQEENARMRSQVSVMSESMEKGSKEIEEAKDNEIKKLTDRVASLEKDLKALSIEKEALEKQKQTLERSLKEGGQGDAALLAAKEKQISELTEQIKIYKAELSDKAQEFQHEKRELQKVIEEQKSQLQRGGGSASGPEQDKLSQDLMKAKKEVQEAAVERERFQSQLEMLVQELEQKQVDTVKSLFFFSVCQITFI